MFLRWEIGTLTYFSDLDPIIIDMFSIIIDMFPTLAKFETLDTQLYVSVPYVRRISEPETWDSPRWRDNFRTVQIDYFSGIPCPPDVIEIVTYAGDWTIIKPNPVIDGICVRLNIYFAELDIWIWKYPPLSQRPHSLPHDKKNVCAGPGYV